MTGNLNLRITASRQFTSWLAEHRIGLAVTTYQAGRLFLIGQKENGQLSAHDRSFRRCMGLSVSAGSGTMWLSSLYQIWRFENALAAGTKYNGYDRVFVPQVGYTTGDVDVHDIGIGTRGEPVFVSTLYSCLATVSDTHSFKPIWQPPFITRLAPEERCHLNGLAMAEGKAAYATSLAESDLAFGWRDQRANGGCLISVQDDMVVLQGLSMPHSPRMHRGKLWLINSGTGELGWVDMQSERFEPVAFCPGYARGLAFFQDFAVVGLSRQRDGAKGFDGLPLAERLASARVEARCGIIVVDLRTGDTVHFLDIDGAVDEVYDVAVIPGCTRPMAIGFLTDEIHRTISIDNGK